MTYNTPAGNTHAADIYRARSAVQRRRLLMVGVSALTLAFTAAAAIGLATVASAQSTGCSGSAAVSHTTTDTGLIADCNALLAAKPDLLGDSSTTLNWSTSLSMAAWHGVGLNDSSTRVAALWLGDYGLQGEIPTELGNLTSLTQLYLDSNQLSGSIPSGLGGLTSLTILDLHSNELSGPIPSGLGNLASLTELYLDSNELSDPIPSGLGNLASLTELYLDSNQLSGSIPTELGNLASLTILDLHSNELSGPIPTELGNLASLTILDLHSNELSGSIPTELGNLASLTILDLHSNELSGPIPTELGNLAGLTILDLYNNELSGSIPTELGNLASLTILDLHSNQLSGCIPLPLTDLLDGQDLGLSACDDTSVPVIDPDGGTNGDEGDGGGSDSGGDSGGGASGGSGGGGSSGGGGGGGGDFDVGVATFVVANGWSPADVGVASVLAARSDSAVVVYTAGDGLSEETRLLLREALPAEVVIVGGNAAVSREVRTQIRAASSESGISRVSGEDRADTAAGTARRILGAPAAAGRITLVVANGWSPPDIGAAAALAARSGRSAVLYTEAGRLPAPSAAVLGDYEVARVILLGGTGAISQDTQNAIAAAAGDDASISRLTGDDRIDTAAQAARRVLGNPAAAPDGVTLVIANGWSAPDVGVAAALAAATDNAAVAYTAQGALPDPTAALIRDYRPTQVIIVGGRAAIADDVRAAITQTAPDSADIRRITGHTRTDTAARAARRILANL
ncbi:cell wall-binding repeat-containing protein [Candidatus Poriferisodalis sp.]|uniref:cell wall-binding repeat-containing protein n=1 Tax=Candidatus Poriferisodalis sp. TaxID=3101277 RepID=UPI003AF71584